MGKPVEIEILLKDHLSSGLDIMLRKMDGMLAKANGAAEQTQILSAAVKALNAQLTALKSADAGIDLNQQENIVYIDRLQEKIKELEAQLVHLGETGEQTQVVPPGLPQAQKQYNGLHTSIQQIAREMPALAMGPQMFFLAISNNLPVFTDELARARKEYDELTKAGQKGVPVWKQVLSSLFSWQTGMMTGILLITMFYKDIDAFFKRFGSGKKEIDSAQKSLKNINEELKNSNGNYGQNVVSLKRLSEEWGKLKNDKDKLVWIKENKSEFDKLGIAIDNVSDAENVFVKNTEAVTSALKSRAMAAAAQSIAQQEYDKALRKRNEAELLRAKADESRKKGEINATGYIQDTRYGTQKSAAELVEERAKGFENEAKIIEKEAATIEKNADSYFKIAAAKEAEAKTALDAAKIKEANGGMEVKINKQIQQSDGELLSLRRENQRNEIALLEEGRQKKLEQIDADYKQQEDEIKKNARKMAELNKELGITGLTQEQQDEVDKANELNIQQKEKQIREVYREEAAAMRDYLKEYGTYQQQKLAIAEEYAEKIRKAQNDGERLTLEKERDAALLESEMDAIRQHIDWGSVFGEFGALFREQLQPTLDRLRTITQSDSFRASSLEEQQILYDLIAKLEAADAVWESDIFKSVSEDITAYQSAMQRYIEAQEREKAAVEALTAARQRQAQAEASGDTDAIQETKEEVAAAEQALAAASTEVQQFGAQVQQTTSDLHASSGRAVGMFQTLESGLQGLSSGSLKGIGDGLMQLDRLFGKGEWTKNSGNALAKGFQSLLGKDSDAAKSLTEALGNTGMAGSIISAILGILDTIAENGVSGIVVSLQDTILGAVDGLLDDLFSGDILVKPLQSALGHVSNILDTVTFGGFGSLMDKISGSNAASVQASIDRLTDRNEALQQSIDDLNDTIKGGEGRKSVAAYEQAYAYQQEQNANYLNIARKQAGYHDSHHSWGYYMNWTPDQIGWIRENIDANFTGTESLWGWTPEQMKELRSNVDIWTSMQNAGKGGYGNRVTDKLDDYIEQAGKLEELENQLNESLTQISFDSMYDSFLESLMDMDASAEEIAGNVSEYFMRALLANQIGEQYKEQLEKWYKDFASAMKDNELTDEERDSLQGRYEQLVEEAMNLRDQLADATGYDGGGSSGVTQTGKPGSFNAMSQEQGTKLEGLFTSGEMHWANMDSQLMEVSEQMGTVAENLRKIEENTGDSAKSLQEIKDDIKKIIRDGLEVK